MWGYKAFSKDLCSQGRHFEIGQEYTKDQGKEGFSFSSFPLSLFENYPLKDYRYCFIHPQGEIGSNNDILICNKMTIYDELSISDIADKALIQMSQDLCWDKTEILNEKEYGVASTTSSHEISSSLGDFSLASSQDYRSIAANTGNKAISNGISHHSAAITTGSRSIALSLGFSSIAGNTGSSSMAITKWFDSVAVNTGNTGVALAAADSSLAITKGIHSVAEVTAARSIALASGHNSGASSQGNQSIAVSLGTDARARGKIGNWLIIAEWKDDELTIQSIKVDNELIKEDTWYYLENGIFKEVEQP